MSKYMCLNDFIPKECHREKSNVDAYIFIGLKSIKINCLKCIVFLKDSEKVILY